VIYPAGVPACPSEPAPVASAPQLAVASGTLSTPDSPFGVVTTSSGAWTFVVMADKVEVLANSGTSSSVYRTLALPAGTSGTGATLSPDGSTVFVTLEGTGGGAVIDVARAVSGQSNALLGVVRNGKSGSNPTSAIHATFSPGGRYVFVSIEYGGGIAVYNLDVARTSQFALKSGGTATKGYVGQVPSGGGATVGSALSSDGKTLFVTNEVLTDKTMGGIAVINVATAESQPASALLKVVAAGCHPVRIAVSPDGASAWVTDREGNNVLAFSTAGLVNTPQSSLQANVAVGSSPVGLAFVANGTRLIVADSNRFNEPSTSGPSSAIEQLSVIDVASAGIGGSSLIGQIQTYAFPREMAYNEATNTLAVTDYNAYILHTINLDTLP
jgi:DNA-binding beta-propeller fold protein YncE